MLDIKSLIINNNATMIFIILEVGLWMLFSYSNSDLIKRKFREEMTTLMSLAVAIGLTTIHGTIHYLLIMLLFYMESTQIYFIGLAFIIVELIFAFVKKENVRDRLIIGLASCISWYLALSIYL